VKNRRFSTGRYIGVLTGLMAAIFYFPTAVPISRSLDNAEHALALRKVEFGAISLGEIYGSGSELKDNLSTRLDINFLAIYDGQNQTWASGIAPPGFTPTWCESTSSKELHIDGEPWAVACHHMDEQVAVAAWRPTFPGVGQFFPTILGLSLIVGLSTMLGVISILSPLKGVSVALRRMSQGQRGVRIEENTRMAEIDDLIAQLNLAAQAAEDREDAILQQMDVVQEMARMVAHEVRNPLQTMEFLVSLVAAEPDATRRNEAAESIRNEIHELDHVVTRLLPRSGNASLALRKESTSLASLVKLVSHFQYREAQRTGVRFSSQTDGDLELPIDTLLMRRAIENLVQNAIRAVSARRGSVTLDLQSTGTEAILTVDDDGDGVPEALVSTMFDRDVSGFSGGSGLGLHLAKRVVDAHDGTLTYERSPMGGARFTIRLSTPEGVPDADSSRRRQAVQRERTSTSS